MSGWINSSPFKSANAHVPAREKDLEHDTSFTPLGTPTQGQKEVLAKAPAMADAMRSRETVIMPRFVFSDKMVCCHNHLPPKC
mmetsp:Transcript_1521/g.2709  ORF Transcript_1521/g.2709 Transcript_1521/m.2709 type:complete len:83 (+) Transcript_1521:470-718(+)